MSTSRGLLGIARRRAHAAVMRVHGQISLRIIRKHRRWRWRGLRLSVPAGVFHPGLFFSSAVLAAEIERRRPLGRTVLDVGCGSGVLALAAARAGAAVTAVDINPAAVQATSANAADNGLTIEVLLSDLFAAVAGRRFDVVAVNPPYFAKDPVDDAERAWFAGADLGYFDRFFRGLVAHLTIDGTALMVLAEGCDMATIDAAASRHGVAKRAAVHRRKWFGAQTVFELTIAR